MTHYEKLKGVIIKQTDPHLPKSFNRFGCRAACLIAIPQFIAGEAISISCFESILLHSLDEPRVFKPEWSTGANENWLIDEVFRRLKVDRQGRQVGWTSEHVDSRKWEYMIVHWQTDGTDGHFTLYDRSNKEIYDPHDPKQAGYSVNKKSIIKRLVYHTWEI